MGESIRAQSGPVRPFVVADIGGTHARVALMAVMQGHGRAPEALAYRKYRCADFPGVVPLLRSFLSESAAIPVRDCVLACAGQVVGDEIVNDNLAWPVNVSEVARALGLDAVKFVNDFEALAYAITPELQDDCTVLCAGKRDPAGPVLVVGPGTGLGAAVRFGNGAGQYVLSTEAGQMDYAPVSLRERAIIAALVPDGGYVPVEMLVSGPGLLMLYRGLCGLEQVAPVLDSPEAVTAMAQSGRDALAREATEIFCAALGSFVGNLAMTFMATGGVYLAGGFLDSMQDFLRRSEFEQRFLHARSARALLEQIPVSVMAHGRHGVLGAARWFLGNGLRGALWSPQPPARTSRSS